MREISYHHEPGHLPETLQSVPFLRGLDSALIDRLLTDTVLLECEPGDSIIQEGERTKFFCILLRGAMDIVKNGKTVSRVSNSGDMLGELALVSDTARTATVVAAKNSFCLKIEPDFLEGLNDAERNGFYAALYQFVAKILSDRLEESSRKIAQLEELTGNPGVGASKSVSEESVYRL